MNLQLIIGGVISGAVLTLMLMLNSCNSDKEALHTTVVSLTRDYLDLNRTVNTQNEAVEKNRIDYERKLKEYKESNPKIKKIYVTKYINDVNITRGDCSDVKTLINNIRNSSL